MPLNYSGFAVLQLTKLPELELFSHPKLILRYPLSYTFTLLWPLFDLVWCVCFLQIQNYLLSSLTLMISFCWKLHNLSPIHFSSLRASTLPLFSTVSSLCSKLSSWCAFPTRPVWFSPPNLRAAKRKSFGSLVLYLLQFHWPFSPTTCTYFSSPLTTFICPYEWQIINKPRKCLISHFVCQSTTTDLALLRALQKKKFTQYLPTQGTPLCSSSESTLEEEL